MKTPIPILLIVLFMFQAKAQDGLQYIFDEFSAKIATDLQSSIAKEKLHVFAEGLSTQIAPYTPITKAKKDSIIEEFYNKLPELNRNIIKSLDSLLFAGASNITHYLDAIYHPHLHIQGISQIHGAKVGNGVCTTLVATVLNDNGAKIPYEYAWGFFRRFNVYTWGKEILKLEKFNKEKYTIIKDKNILPKIVGIPDMTLHITTQDNETVLPGDIVLFEYAQMRYDYDDVSIYTGFSNHVAIVYDIIDDGQYLIIEQNVSGSLKWSHVKLNELDLNKLVDGKIAFYRPQKL